MEIMNVEDSDTAIAKSFEGGQELEISIVKLVIGNLKTQLQGMF